MLVTVTQAVALESHTLSFADQITITDVTGQRVVSQPPPPGQVTVGTVIAQVPAEIIPTQAF